MTIRRATPEEIPAIAALALESFAAEVAPHYSDEGIRTFLEFASAEAMFRRVTGLEWTHVPFRGGAPSLTAGYFSTRPERSCITLIHHALEEDERKKTP